MRDGIDLQRVVVVDNASSDQSLTSVRETDLPICVHANASNLGFAAGCNQGARSSKATYLLFLNPDTRLTTHSLKEPLYFMEQGRNASVGICGIRLLDDGGAPATCSAKFPTQSSMWAEGTGLHRLSAKRFGTRRQSGPVEPVECVDQIIGAYFLVRREVFERLDGFDETFFVYFEEVDFSLRARRAGYTSCVLGNVSAFHTGCCSSNQVKDKRLFYSWRSRLIYARKHFSWPARCGTSILTLLVEPIARLLHAVMSGSVDTVLATARAYMYLLIDITSSSDNHNARQARPS